MRYPRVYVNTSLSAGSQITLSKQASHHIGQVLRRKPGQLLHVFDGTGGYYPAEVMSVDKRAVVVNTGNLVNDKRESPLSITLAQGISRGQHMDFTIQKAVELGVRRIVPVLTEHGNVRLDEQRTDKRLVHWRKIIISACEQCGRNFIPEITEPVAFTDWLGQEQAALKLILEPASAMSLNSLNMPEGDVSLLSGPEGGFSAGEVESADFAGFQPVRLGPRILRTETAAVAALAAMQALWGDMG